MLKPVRPPSSDLLSQIKLPYLEYLNIRVIHPDWPTWKAWAAAITATLNFFAQRICTILFLLYDFFPFAFEVRNKEILDELYKKSGVVFISVHMGPYPLAGRVIQEFFSRRPMVIPFNFQGGQSIFPLFEKRFLKYGVKIVPLGGAMKEIDPVLKKGGSVVLCMDAVLPVKHTMPVSLFGKTIPLPTGPVFISKKYNLPIVPVYTIWENNKVVVVFGEPVNTKGSDEIVMKRIAETLETMIAPHVWQWHAFDVLLLR